MSIVTELTAADPERPLAVQPTRDGIPTLWVARHHVHDMLDRLKRTLGYRILYDLTVIDERVRRDRANPHARDFTIVYHLSSFVRNEDVRIKVALAEQDASLGTVTDLWPAANWYEREAWDMFGIAFDGHPHLTRILMPPTWNGHPLRKDHPARATEMG
ncbi:MAG: NADH-quinone oxidoreductase subunit C, partial [Acidobacteria bacterium]|nr:NADH-quinone oxidoreductase subunit C [Acidobacteriota bacterium]